MVKIRLSRHGRKKRPFYFIVIADVRAARDGKFIEKIGTYDPFSKDVNIKSDRIEYWNKQGAQATDRVKKIYAKYNQAIAS